MRARGVVDSTGSPRGRVADPGGAGAAGSQVQVMNPMEPMVKEARWGATVPVTRGTGGPRVERLTGGLGDQVEGEVKEGLERGHQGKGQEHEPHGGAVLGPRP